MLKEKSQKPTKKLSLKTITLKDLQSVAGGGYGTSVRFVGPPWVE